MRISAAIAILLFAFTATSAEATFMQDRSLYQRLGGKKVITAVVDDFVGNVARDKRINKFFANTDIPRLKRSLVELHGLGRALHLSRRQHEGCA